MARSSIFIAALAAFLAVTAAMPSASTCDFDIESSSMEDIQEKVMELLIGCVQHEPSLMETIMSRMSNPDSVSQTEIMCSNQRAMVDVFLCLKGKLMPCMPYGDARNFMDEMITRDRSADAISFLCDHKKELMASDQCFDLTTQQEFVSCYVRKVESLATSFMRPADIQMDFKRIICQVIGTEEACLRAHHGTCARSYVNLLIQFLDKFFPMDGCPKINYKDLAQNSPFNSILVHGRPLKFQPYRMVNGNGL